MIANRILEIGNDWRTINQFAIFVYFSWFLLAGMRANSSPQTVMLADLAKMARCLAFALWTWVFGAVVIGVTIKIQRSGLGGMAGLPAWWTVPPMTIGSYGLGLGALLVFRIMTIARHGNWMWLALLGVGVIYLAVASL